MPTSKNLLFILLLLNLVWALPSCGPKDCHDDGTCPPEYYRFKLGEAKDYLWAKPGSYWIYKNTLNGALDTQTCTYFYFDSFTVTTSSNTIANSPLAINGMIAGMSQLVYFIVPTIIAMAVPFFNNLLYIFYAFIAYLKTLFFTIVSTNPMEASSILLMMESILETI